MTETEASVGACKLREAELLEFTQKLTEANTTLQSDLSSLKIRWSAAETEHSALSGTVDDLETRLAEATGLLEAEKRTRVQVLTGAPCILPMRTELLTTFCVFAGDGTVGSKVG